MKITLFGLGEAGSLIGADLAAAGAAVRGYDPADVTDPAGVMRCDGPQAAVIGADVVIGLTGGIDAMTALTQALDRIPQSALYADFSTAAAALKRDLARVAQGRGLDFVDIALMGTVPGRGLKTPALAAGPGARRFVQLFAPMGMPVSEISTRPGAAATRKLLRSIMMKGLAAAVIEAMRGAEQAGCAEWLWQHLAGELAAADGDLLARLVRGTATHAVRRLDEMRAARDLLEELGVNPLLTGATVASLEDIPGRGIPEIPQRSVPGAEPGTV